MDNHFIPFQRTWTDDKIFADKTTGLAVKVRKSNDRTPLFTVETCAQGDGKDFSRMRVGFSGRRTGKISVAPFHTILAGLLTQAYEHIHQALQAVEDEYIQTDIDRADRQAKRNSGQQRPGLKKLGKMDRGTL